MRLYRQAHVGCGAESTIEDMRDPASDRQMLSDLRFALDVMEERSHIGLDDEGAATMRRVLLSRIVEAEKAVGYPPSTHRMGNSNANEPISA